MAWFDRSSTTGRRGRAAVATAAATATLATTLVTGGAPAGASAGDRPQSAVPGFVLSHGRYTAFEAPEAGVEIFPTGINDRGEVTGEYIRPDRDSGFVRAADGTITTFDVPGARGTQAVKINDRGQVVGRYSEGTPFVDDSTGGRGFVRYRGAFTRLDVPDATQTLPTGINDRGDVVGYYVGSDGASHGFVWRDEQFTTLDVPQATAPTPVDINDRGDVIGLYLDDAGAPQGFLLREGRYRSIAAPGAPTTVPFGINDRGQIVGYTADDLNQTGARGFLLPNGVDGPFMPVGFPGAPKSVALGINDEGDVVGLHENPDLEPRDPGTVGVRPGPMGNVDLVTVRGITVNAAIGAQVEGLLAVAEADGLGFTGGGYRDADRQIALRRANCGTSYYAIYEMPAGSCSPPTARPGTSQHEQGLAIDFNCDGKLIRTRMNRCYRWLADHAAGYGLYNLPSEPWHWSTNGQ